MSASADEGKVLYMCDGSKTLRITRSVVCNQARPAGLMVYALNEANVRHHAGAQRAA
jgi:hypothetical protein